MQTMSNEFTEESGFWATIVEYHYRMIPTKSDPRRHCLLKKAQAVVNPSAWYLFIFIIVHEQIKA